MFKKRPSSLKTSSPLKNSDRRKLKQRVVAAYPGVTNEEGDVLVPDGILMQKFITHLGEPGVAYVSPDTSNDPLWFTIGKNSEQLIPTIYTLWKKQDLVPFLSTPSAVTPILIGGADLMIPGVIHCPPDLPEKSIVAVRQYTRRNNTPYLSPPVAVGFLALPSSSLRSTVAPTPSQNSNSNSTPTPAHPNVKGKAVLIAHTWKDHLFEMGSRAPLPADTSILPGSENDDVWDDGEDVDDEVEEDAIGEEEEDEEEDEGEGEGKGPPSSDDEEGGEDGKGEEQEEEEEEEDTSSTPRAGPSSLPGGPPLSSSSQPTQPSYTPEETSTLLLLSLQQAIRTFFLSSPLTSTGGNAKPISFPIPAAQFYSSYILPSRPAFPERVLPPSSPSSSSSSNTPTDQPQSETQGQTQTPSPDPHSITLKSSTHKSLSSFFKSAERAGLLSLKQSKGHKSNGEVVVVGVNAANPDVVRSGEKGEGWATLRDLEAKASKKAAKEGGEGGGGKEGQGQGQGSREVQVRELWKVVEGGAGGGGGWEVGEVVERGGGSKSELYTAPEIRGFINTYITQRGLVNRADQGYVDVGRDEVLQACVRVKVKSKAAKPSMSTGGAGKAKGKLGHQEEEEQEEEHMKRDEIVRRVMGKMQSWYEVRVSNGSPSEPDVIVRKKGPLSPIKVVTKTRQGKKASTLITGFEPFLVVQAEEMADELRRVCAGSTGVSPIHGRPAGSGQEVLVQGKQVKAVVEYLVGKGVPRRWIDPEGLSGGGGGK